METTLNAQGFAPGSLVVKDGGFLSDPALYCRGEYIDLYGPPVRIKNDEGNNVIIKAHKRFMARYPDIYVDQVAYPIGRKLSLGQRLLVGGPLWFTIALIPLFGWMFAVVWLFLAAWQSKRNARAFHFGAQRLATLKAVSWLIACMIAFLIFVVAVEVMLRAPVAQLGNAI